jgi:hypothetical protein
MIIDEFDRESFRKNRSDRVFPDTRWSDEVDDGVGKGLAHAA